MMMMLLMMMMTKVMLVVLPLLHQTLISIEIVNPVIVHLLGWGKQYTVDRNIIDSY